MLAALLKKQTTTQAFVCKFCEIFKIIFFSRIPLVAATFSLIQCQTSIKKSNDKYYIKLSATHDDDGNIIIIIIIIMVLLLLLLLLLFIIIFCLLQMFIQSIPSPTQKP